MGRPVRDPDLALTRVTFLPRFDVTGETACNRFAGRVHTGTAANKIVGFENLTATEMACPPKKAQAEATTLRLLRDTANIARAGNSISLFNANGVMIAQLSSTEPRAAAAQDARGAEPKATAPTRSVIGDYVLSELGGVPVAVRTPPNVVPQPVTPPNTRFLTILPTLYLRDGGAATGLSGCNQFTTSIVVSPDLSQVFGPLASTRRRCLDRPTERTEREVQTAFRDARRVVASATRVTLYRTDGARLARFSSVSTRTNAAPSLFGTTWVLRSLTGARVPATNPPSIVFEGNQVIGNAGCNRFNMVHTRRSGRSRFQDGAMTRMACAETSRAQLESQFMSALGFVSNTSVTASQLTLSSEDGRTVLVFDAE
jgi:heat shock protein HslJ